MIKKYLIIIIITFFTLIIFFLSIKYEKKLESKLINQVLKEKLMTEQEYDKVNLNEINNKELLNIYINENLIPLSDKNNFYNYFLNITSINAKNKDSENISKENTQNSTINKSSNSNKNNENLKINFPIDLNSATYQELIQIPGIGDTLAKRILEYREKNGKFISIDELLKIKGIGQKTFEKIKSYFIIK